MTDLAHWPMRVEAIHAAARTEWRVGEKLPARLCPHRKLVYVSSGAVEECCRDEEGKTVVPLSAGQMLLLPPHTYSGMKAVGEVPPEVFRLEFDCEGPMLEQLQMQAFRPLAAERAYLEHLVLAGHEVFVQTEHRTALPQRRAGRLFAADQQMEIILELLLISLVRRTLGTRPLTAKVRRERQRTLLCNAVEVYFSRNLDQPLTVEQVCRENGCTRAALQKAFRARNHMGAMEYFAVLKVERAKELLAEGRSPGETAAALGYGSGAYFSRRFKELTGRTPREFQKKFKLNKHVE